MKYFKQALFAVLCVFSLSLSASDLAKEKRWADQVVDAVMDGEVIWLNDRVSDFLGIYTEAENDKHRAVIVMHGTGIHPDWQQVVQPLRVGLTGHDWNTLSIQMPILANEAEYEDYAPLYDEVSPRIDAAIKYLHDIGTKEIVLIAHSQGAAMAAYYLSTHKSDTVDGFVAIGMPFFAKDKRMNAVLSMQKLTLPVLDLYGKEDLPGVIESSVARANAAKTAGNKTYLQKQISGNHFFDGEEDLLVQTVADWLDSI